MKRQRILIIEDDSKTASSVRGYLQHQGFDAEVENDGLQGLERARASTWPCQVKSSWAGESWRAAPRPGSDRPFCNMVRSFWSATKRHL